MLGPESCQTGPDPGRVVHDVHGWLPANSSCCYGKQASITDGSCVNQGLVYKRSTDNGMSWSAAIELAAPNRTHFYSNPVPVYDRIVKVTFLAVSICHTMPMYSGCSVWIAQSGQDGAPRSFSAFRRVSHGIDDFEIGENGGIQLQHGRFAGRLLIPNLSGGLGYLLSDDHGSSWRFGDYPSNWTHFGINENQAAELPDGSLRLQSRMCCPPLPYPYPQNETDTRVESRSFDGGEHWEQPTVTHKLEGDNIPGELFAVSQLSSCGFKLHLRFQVRHT